MPKREKNEELNFLYLDEKYQDKKKKIKKSNNVGADPMSAQNKKRQKQK